MASQPPQPPESIVLGAFAGIRNNIAEERLAPNDLQTAINVDIDDAGQLRRRRGRTLVHASRHHSLVEIAGRHLVVRDGVLGFLSDGFVFDAIAPGGDEPISYTAVGNDIYFSSNDVSGKIIHGTVEAWGQTGGDGIWISPVMRPTDTLGAISGRMLSKPPMATEIEAYKGRIYLANGPVLWNTELYIYDLVDKTKNYVIMEHDITMVRAVSDGLYVGTTAALYFLQGTAAKGMQLTMLRSTPVIPGSATTVPYPKVHPQARNGPIPEGEGPVFLTSDGICLGLDGGTVFNLTQGRMQFPDAQRAAALYREDQGANSYVVAADSAGGPRANTRIGDYADAEIVRASQRG